MRGSQEVRSATQQVRSQLTPPGTSARTTPALQLWPGGALTPPGLSEHLTKPGAEQ